MKASKALEISSKIRKENVFTNTKRYLEKYAKIEKIAKKDFPALSRKIRKKIRESVNVGNYEINYMIDSENDDGDIYLQAMGDLIVNCYEKDGYKVFCNTILNDGNSYYMRPATRYWMKVDISWEV